MKNKNPALSINLQKIQYNAHLISTLCHKYGIQVAGVTKGFCAIPEVAEAMLQGGCSMLADSRIQNLQKLQEFQFDVEYMLLRAPMMSEVDDVVQHADVSLNSSIETIKALNRAARRANTRHKIILMIDVGDLREGIWPDQLHETVDGIVRCDRIIFEGLGCNLGCYGGIIPTPDNMNFLLKQKEYVETTYQLTLNYLSGGSSCGIHLLRSGKMPPGINHFRVGEAILLGRSTTDQTIFPDMHQETMILRAEIIEKGRKPSIPIGKRGRDGFGNSPEFEDNGMRQRALLALGQQDVVQANTLTPLDHQVKILGATSDHLIVDVTETDIRYEIGDVIEFHLSYTNMLAAASSEYVSKEFVTFLK